MAFQKRTPLLPPSLTYIYIYILKYIYKIHKFTEDYIGSVILYEYLVKLIRRNEIILLTHVCALANKKRHPGLLLSSSISTSTHSINVIPSSIP